MFMESSPGPEGTAPLSVEVEVVQSDKSRMDPEAIRKRVMAWASTPGTVLADLRSLAVAKQKASNGAEHDWLLADHVDKLELWGPGHEDDELVLDHMPANNCRLTVHVFKLNKDGAQAEEMETDDGDEDGGGAGVTAAMHWILPSQELQGVWESLIYEKGLKKSLLNYVKTTLRVSDHKIDSNLVSWNRIILLHGPPGTGKTSLCRALAQKLAIRLSHRYRYGQLIEVNSHSLFSKWFSESGKLVQKMFEAIQEIVDDPEAFVCVLVDEVESLAAVRNSSGSEPSDAIRVVNAMLTQLDKLKQYPNVLLMTTSNITGSIDLAFVDRADLKKYIGLPCKEARYTMLRGSTSELLCKQLLSSKSSSGSLEHLLTFKQLAHWLSRTGREIVDEAATPINSRENGRYSNLAASMRLQNGNNTEESTDTPDKDTKEADEQLHVKNKINNSETIAKEDPINLSKKLVEIASRCEDLSGRTIRKLPFLALVKMEDEGRLHTLEDFLDCLGLTVDEQRKDKEAFSHKEDQAVR